MQIDETNETQIEPAEQVEAVPAPGELLMAERLRRGLDEKDVADKLHITMHYVRAIETNHFEKLPGAVFTRGYIRSYALLLGLNPQPLTAMFDSINSAQQGIKDEEGRRQVARRRSDRNKPWVYVSVGTFVLGMTALWAYNHFSADDTVATPLPANGGGNNAAPVTTIASRPMAQTPALTATTTPVLTTTVEPTPVLPASAEPAAATTTETATDTAAPASDLLTVLTTLASDSAQTVVEAPPASPRYQERVIKVDGDGEDVLRISFSGESWIEVNDRDSKQLYRDILEAGDVLEINGKAPYNVLVGDAPYASMSLNGTEIDLTDNIRIDNSARLTVGL